MSMVFLSVVIPAYNEEKRIGDSLYKIINYMKNKGLTFEIIVADDGSSDKTGEVVKRIIAGKATFKYLKSDLNMGKGNAVKQGMLASQGDFSLLTDADLSTPIETLDTFIPKMTAPDKVIIGTRKAKGARVTKHQTFIRENMGKCFTLLTNILLLMKQSDYTCGFKVFGAKARSRIFSAQQIDRWGYDAEILFLAKQYKYTIQELPVIWENSEATKVNLLLDTARSFKELFEIRLNHIFRRY